MTQGQRLSLGGYVALACHWEVAAPKPGNVSRAADFADTTLQDFLLSGEVLGNCLERAGEQSVGQLVLQAVIQTRAWVGQNTNLGLILLLAPLAKAAARAGDSFTQADVHEVLAALGPSDARDVYQAIRLAAPGGLGRVPERDVHDASISHLPDNLLSAMQLAASRDLVAAQYTGDFSTVFLDVAPAILRGIRGGWSLPDALVAAQLQTMARHPDSLIARKCGNALAEESAERAADVLRHEDPHSAGYRQALAEFDTWLRADGNRRNPGTTADLIGAALFVCLFNRQLPYPRC